MNNSEKYFDYPNYDQFLEWEFLPAKCAGMGYYWVSFKNGNGEGNYKYFYGLDNIADGAGFIAPDSTDWPELSEFHYENAHPIPCYNEKYKVWSWFATYTPFFDEVTTAGGDYIYRLLDEDEDSVYSWIGLNKDHFENNGWDLSPLFAGSLFNMTSSKKDVWFDEIQDYESQNKPKYEQYVTRMVIDVYFEQDQISKPYGFQGQYDCGTVQSVLKDLKDAGKEVHLLSCVTNAATTIEGPNSEILHPALRESRGEVDV